MPCAALKQANAVSVTNHAIERRLTLERATKEEISWILDSRRQVVEELIQREVEAAIELVPEARRIFIHPGREAVIGLAKPRVYFDRSGRRRESAGFRISDNRYLWSGDVIYVVDHQTVVTCILPDERQVMTLFSVMPQAESLGCRMRSIMLEVDRSSAEAPQAGCRGGVVPISQAHRRRETPPTAEWMFGPSAIWTVIVVGEDDAGAGLEDRAVSELGREAEKGVPIHIENVADKSIERIASGLRDLGRVEVKQMPKPPEVEWSKVNGKIPPTMKTWWQEMAEAGAGSGRLLTVMTPESARSLLETANGSSDAAWRSDGGCCLPGSKLNLIFGGDVVLVARDKY